MVIGKINFPVYGILVILSILIGTLYIAIELKKEKISKDNILYYVVLNIVFCFLGSFILTKVLTNNDGLTSYAGAISSILCAIIFNRIVPNKNIYLKYAIISLPLIYAIGKIGCFLGGCCYGIEYNGILSVTYKEGLNIPLFPIQALESIIFFILFIILNKLNNNKNIIYITLILCASCKLLLDFLRYDHMTKLVTMNQIISLVFILIGILLITKKNLKK